VAHGVAVEREALLRVGAGAGNVRMEDPVEARPAPEPSRRPGQGRDLDVFGLLEFGDLHEVGPHRGRADEEHVVFLGGIDILQIEVRERTGGQRKRHGLRRTERGRRAGEHRQDVLVDLAVHHLDRRHLHDAAAIPLRREDVELGALGLVVPLDEGGGYLGEAVDAGRDVAIEPARDGGCTAGAGHQEHRLVAFDHRLSRADGAEPTRSLLELGDELLAVLDLECRVGHGSSPSRSLLSEPPFRLSSSRAPGCPTATRSAWRTGLRRRAKGVPSAGESAGRPGPRRQSLPGAGQSAGCPIARANGVNGAAAEPKLIDSQANASGLEALD
jgi:hypothetical protein